MKKFALGILVVASLAACNPNPYNIRPVTSEQRLVNDKNYVIGEERLTYVGQSVIVSKDYSGMPVPAFTSPVPFSVKLRDSAAEYPAGTLVRATLRLDHENTAYFAANPSPPLPRGAMLLIDQDGRYRGLAYSHEYEVYTACDDKEFVCVTPASIDFAQAETLDVIRTEKFSSFEIVYSGATKDTIHLLYREYTPDDLARPAYTQNLTYDRGSPVIRFREVQIRVIEASNESLRHVVESDGSRS